MDYYLFKSSLRLNRFISPCDEHSNRDIFSCIYFLLDLLEPCIELIKNMAFVSWVNLQSNRF